MSGTGRVVTLSPRDYDAVIFDLDGVLTRTANAHAAAWKKLFDGFLAERAGGAPFAPFAIDSDYRRYVDGKPRLAGVKSFLAARKIELPLGSPADAPEMATAYGLAPYASVPPKTAKTRGVAATVGSGGWVGRRASTSSRSRT